MCICKHPSCHRPSLLDSLSPFRGGELKFFLTMAEVVFCFDDERINDIYVVKKKPG
jgi:hypothetical protein